MSTSFSLFTAVAHTVSDYCSWMLARIRLEPESAHSTGQRLQFKLGSMLWKASLLGSIMSMALGNEMKQEIWAVGLCEEMIDTHTINAGQSFSQKAPLNSMRKSDDCHSDHMFLCDSNFPDDSSQIYNFFLKLGLWSEWILHNARELTSSN